MYILNFPTPLDVEFPYSQDKRARISKKISVIIYPIFIGTYPDITYFDSQYVTIARFMTIKVANNAIKIEVRSEFS